MNNTIKYFLYARKSSEDKNRQVNSTKDQRVELNRLAKEQGLLIVDVIEESGSAKKPGRKGFNKIVERIYKGEANGILCWKLDRLSRNPLDGGQISWMLQNGIIQHIKTYSSEYKPSDNVLMMQMELGMATQYIKDLKVNVGRGTRAKAERGWNPSPILPIGYKHNPLYLANESAVEITPNLQTFDIVKKLWQLLLTGAFTVIDLKREGDSMGLKNKHKQPFALNTYHLMFKKQFYAGYFYWNDENGIKKEHLGKHKTMINYAEYLQAQKILGNYSNPTRVRTRNFPYRRLILCGECNGHIRAEYIHQVICTNCKHKFSIKTNTICRKCNTDYLQMKEATEIIKKYYRCSKKKNRLCTQKSIEEKNIENYISQKLKDITIDDEFYNWIIGRVERMDKEQQSSNTIFPQLLKQKKELQKRLNGLENMRADGEIDSERYKFKSNEIKEQLNILSQSIRANKSRLVNWKKVAKKRIEFARLGYENFIKDDLNQKKAIVMELGGNLVLKDKSLSITTLQSLLYIKERVSAFKQKKQRVQPKEFVEKYRDFDAIIPLNPKLLADY